MPIQEDPPPYRRRRRRRIRYPPAELPATSSESESDDTWHTPGSTDEMPGCLSDGGVDLESGELEMKVHSKRDCRICHLRLDDGESGLAIELGCNCKGDLAAAHLKCADTWFKIKGNTTCEICGATALNVVGEQTNDLNANAVAAAASATATSALPVFLPPLAETQNYWPGRRLMNVLLGCMIFAFIISWLFHFDLLSHHK